MKKTILYNGLVFQDDKFIPSDILIDGGKIALIGKGLNQENTDQKTDCSGLHIFPGGIDPHVHMHLPTPAGTSADDFVSGSLAAIAGGTTSFIDFVTPLPGQSIIEALEQRRLETAGSQCYIKFHVSPIHWTNSTEHEIKHCIQNEGIKSFKVYMAYQSTIGSSTEDIFKIMKAVGKYGGMVTIHCETDEEIERLKAGFISRGRTHPVYHPLSRPGKLEAQAVKQAIRLAQEAECPLYIVHVSAKESLEYINDAQSKGQVVYAETCPQYLLLEDSLYDQDFERSCAYVMSPPLRKKADNEALWQAINEDIIQTVGTDHCPFTLEQKKLGIDNFTKIPNGAGGVEHRLSLLYTYGVEIKRISLKKFFKITAENPAKLFGLTQKGKIKTGMDADLGLWNLNKTAIISKDTHHQYCDLNIYEGFQSKGVVQKTIIGGKIVWDADQS